MRLSIAVISGFFVNNTLADDSYRFERMWPTLQQPWYFNQPDRVVIDEVGNVIVADTFNHRLVKLNSQGKIINTTNFFTEDRKLLRPRALVMDDEGFIFLITNNVVAMFDANLRYVKTLITDRFSGEGGSYFHSMILLEDHLYITYREGLRGVAENYKVWEYSLVDGASDPNWGHRTHWGDEVADGSVDKFGGIAADSEGNIYITAFSEIQKYDSSGNLINSFRPPDSVLGGAVFSPHGLTIDSQGVVYTHNFGTIFKFSLSGAFIELIFPARTELDEAVYGVEIVEEDGAKKLFVSGIRGIYSVSEEGSLIESWGSRGSNVADRFDGLGDIGISSSGTVYMLDAGAQVYKIDKHGSKFGPYPLSNGEGFRNAIYVRNEVIFISSRSMTPTFDTNSVSNIYAFNSEMENVSSIPLNIGHPGAEVYDFLVGEDGEIFASIRIQENFFDFGINKLMKFDSSGEKLFESKIEATRHRGINLEFRDDATILATIGADISVLDFDLNIISSKNIFPSYDDFQHSLAVDSGGNIFVAGVSIEGGRINKYSADFELLETFSSIGLSAGQLSSFDIRIATDSDDNLYAADWTNLRLQKFRPVGLANNSKAIVVAAGGPFAGNNLWDSTQLSANFAYRALTYQGFTKDSLYYLSSNTNLDLDLNGVADDVDADATNVNLEYAIREWAADADNLVIYLVDHGGVDTFRMTGTEILSSSSLASWLNELQATMPGRVTIVYDACESGTFMSTLKPPLGFDRTVITSTSPGENAVFVSQGSISFSNFFWTHLFNGLSLEDSFSLASQALTSTTDHQHPMMDYNGDGLSDGADLAATSNVFIGNGTDLQAEAPTIFGVSAGQVISGISTASVIAEDVTDSDGISRVWAIVRPPDYQQGESGNPVQDLPSFELRSDDNGNYTGSWDQYTTAGTYQLAIYASDRNGNTSVPLLTTVSVESPLSKRAILIAAGAANDPDYSIASNSTDVAYEALKQQGYDEDSIYYMNKNGVPGFDVSPSLSNLDFYLTDISGADTADLVLYIVGQGTSNAITLRDGETLTPAQLGSWLNTLTDKIPGNVTVVLDTDNAGSFIAALSGNKRIIIASTGATQQAHFLNQGDISFSHSYWRKVFNGASVREAFLYARSSMRFSAGSQEAQLDDNGDQIPNTKQDGFLAKRQNHGSGILLAGDEPLIGTVSANDEVTTGESNTISVSNVTTTGTIDKVIAVVTTPDQFTNTYALEQSADIYSTNAVDFNIPGSYDIALYARDTAGNLSLPSTATIKVEEKGFVLDLSTNQSSFTSGNTLTLSTAATLGSRDYTGAVDLYLEIILPDGSTFFLSDLSPSISATPTPILGRWSPDTFPSTPILSFPLPEGLTPGNYTWKITFTKTGQSYNNASGWLAQGRVVHGIQ